MIWTYIKNVGVDTFVHFFRYGYGHGCRCGYMDAWIVDMFFGDIEVDVKVWIFDTKMDIYIYMYVCGCMDMCIYNFECEYRYVTCNYP